MNIADIMRQTGATESIARDLGIDAATAQAGANALLPAILGGFAKQAQAQPAAGLGGLVDMLGQAGGGNLLETITGSAPTPAAPGNDILGQIFGSKDVSRTVAGQAAETTGIDANVLKKMLPLLAMAVTGYLASQQGGAAGGASPGGLGGILGSLLGGGQSGSGHGGGGGLSGGLGGLGSLLDRNGDGNPLDDIIAMAGRLKR